MRITIIAVAAVASLLAACGPGKKPETVTQDEMAGGDEARTRVNDDRTRVNDDRTRVNDDRTRVNDDRTRVNDDRTRVNDDRTMNER